MNKRRRKAEMVDLVCAECGRAFQRPDYTMRGQKEFFCGWDCSGVGHQVHDRGAVFDFLVEYVLEYGRPPTYREIGAACDISSTSMVRHVLTDLAEAGKITLPPKGSRRGLEVVGMRMVFEGERGNGIS